MKACQQKYCTVKVNEGLVLLKKTLRSNSAEWLRPLALEPNYLGWNPSSTTHQPCDLVQVTQCLYASVASSVKCK